MSDEKTPLNFVYRLFRNPQIQQPVLYLLLVGLCLVVPNLALAAIARIFVDRVFQSHVLSWESGIVIALLIIAGGIACLTFLQRTILTRLNSRFSLRLNSSAFWNMLRLPMSFYANHSPGEIAYRLTLNDSISSTLTGNLGATIIEVLFATIYGIAMLYYDVVIALVAFALVALNLLIMRLTYDARSETYPRYQDDYGNSVAYSIGGLHNMETIKASGMEVKYFSHWAGYYTKVINDLQKLGKKDIALQVVTPLLESLSIIVLIGVSAWRIINGGLSVGMFVALQILLYNFITPIRNLAGFTQAMQLLKVDLGSVENIMSHPIDPIFQQKEEEVESDAKVYLKGDVELHDVTFGYSHNEEPIVKHIALTLAPGKSVALVGPTGCGKSTIAKVIAGLYPPWSGDILFDGIPQHNVLRKKLVYSLALVEQEPFLFNGTLMENLTLLDPIANTEDVLRATKDACIHEDILARPGGYDMEIIENGSNLSGGQKQRIEIARALVKNPTIVIMDEVTSALDATMESEILTNIRQRGCAILLIAHRLSTVSSCDEIIVIDKGQIIARGTHEELKSYPGLYRDLIESERG